MFRTVFPSIIRNSRLYMQQQACVKQILCLFANKQTAVSVCCCMYSLELLMMDGETIRNMWCLSYLLTNLHTYLLTYLLTYSMAQSPSWEANWFAASQEIPRISRNPKVHYRTHKRPPPFPILGQPNLVHIPTSHLLEIHPNIIHPSTPRSPQWFFPSGFPTKTLYTPLSSPIHATFPAISFFSILSPAQYWVRSTTHLAPRYAVSSIPPLPRPS